MNRYNPHEEARADFARGLALAKLERGIDVREVAQQTGLSMASVIALRDARAWTK